MEKDINRLNSSPNSVDRRMHARVRAMSVVYVELGRENGGLMLNMSEDGMAVRAAEVFKEANVTRMRFCLPNSQRWIEVDGRLVWQGPSRKKAGVQFVNLGDEARRQIQNWVGEAVVRPGIPVKTAEAGAEIERVSQTPVTTGDSRDRYSAFESAFPSEKNRRESDGRTPDQNLSEPKKGEAGIFFAEELEQALNQFPLDGDRPQERRPQRHRMMIVADRTRQHAAPPGDRQKDRTGANQSTQGQTPEHTSGVESLDAGVEERQSSGTPAVSSSAPQDSHDDAGLTRNVAEGAFHNNSTERDLQPHAFSGFGYSTTESEERPAKRWLAVAGVVLAILAAGTVLAMGPSNVKVLLLQLVRQPSMAVQTPPPPENALEKAPAESTAPPAVTNETSSPTEKDEAAPATPPVQSAATPEATSQNGSAAPAQSDREAKVENNRPSPPAVKREPLKDVSDTIHPQTADDTESSEEMTRRFQLEHGEAVEGVDGATNYPAAEVERPEAQDAGFSVAPTPSSNSAELPRSEASPVAPTLASGLVAISSHFESVQGTQLEQAPDGGRLSIGQLISIKQPVYSIEARREHVEGTVRLRVVVDEIGQVEAVYVVSGPPMLVPAAIDAVREWRYAQTLLGPQALKSVEDVAVVFRLGSSLESPR